MKEKFIIATTDRRAPGLTSETYASASEVDTLLWSLEFPTLHPNVSAHFLSRNPNNRISVDNDGITYSIRAA